MRLRTICLIAFAITLFNLVATAAEPLKDDPKPALVGNSVCPVSGKPVAGKPDAPSFFSDFKGWRIGFMCPVCKGQFDAADEAQKLVYLNRALQSVGRTPAK